MCLFFVKKGIDGCDLITEAWKNNTNSCEGNTFIDTCQNQVNYKCNYTPTTRATTKTTKRPYIYYASGANSVHIETFIAGLMILLFALVY